MKNSLDKKGLSLSQAQSVSNILNQKALDIASDLSMLNNYSRSIRVGGEDLTETQGVPMYEDIVERVSKKAKYHAAQAFLMENIKAKDTLLESIKTDKLVYEVDAPKPPSDIFPKLLPEVAETWAIAQLSVEEINEFILKEAEASHLGQFIHKSSKLEQLRKELPTIKTLDWMEVEVGKKTPVKVNVHHTTEQLAKVYEDFSALHRHAEQRVNYYKAKVKNLVTVENARIAELNSTEQERVNNLNSVNREIFTNAMAVYREAYTEAVAKFEIERKKRIQEASALRIKVSPLFKATIDEILGTIEEEK